MLIREITQDLYFEGEADPWTTEHKADHLLKLCVAAGHGKFHRRAERT